MICFQTYEWRSHDDEERKNRLKMKKKETQTKNITTSNSCNRSWALSRRNVFFCFFLEYFFTPVKRFRSEEKWALISGPALMFWISFFWLIKCVEQIVEFIIVSFCRFCVFIYILLSIEICLSVLSVLFANHVLDCQNKMSWKSMFACHMVCLSNKTISSWSSSPNLRFIT